MKKKVIIIICILACIILLFPVKQQFKDGGSVQYKAILYSVTKVHRLALGEWDDGKAHYETGIEILGIEVFNNCKVESSI